jgi:hypothetical protein
MTMNNPVTAILGASGDVAPTTSLDLPPALASILSLGNTPAPSGMVTAGGISSGMATPGAFSYQAGGMIGPGGAPDMTGAGVGVSPQTVGQGGTMSPQMLEMQINQFAMQRPQELAQIRQVIMQLLQSGELTQQELNMTIQLATVAAQNPEMYPNVRRFAIQQGISTEQDLPQQYDQGLIFLILLAARAVQADIGGQNMMQGGTPAMAGAPSMAEGGAVPKSKKSDGSVLINAHEGEYVVPANVVKMKGKEFFDSLVEKYKES